MFAVFRAPTEPWGWRSVRLRRRRYLSSGLFCKWTGTSGTSNATSLELPTRLDILTRVDHASQAREAQIARFRQMTPGERWIAARDLYWSVRRLKEAFIRQQHPEWSNDRVAAAVREAFSHVRD